MTILTMLRCFRAFVFLSIFVFAADASLAKSAALMPEPEYLLFQFFTAGPGFSTEGDEHVISRLPDPQILDHFANEVLTKIGDRGDAVHRLGITVGPLVMDYTDAQMREVIKQTFEIATKYKIAVALHLDDSKFWKNRHDLWGDPDNVEWMDWAGTPNTGQYLNWGEPWKLAPQSCFNSPRMIKEARRLAGEIIGPAIAENLGKLKGIGEEALFAGVFVGWETAIGRDFATGRSLGYCALRNRGFNERNTPRDPDAELEVVVRDWIDTWAKSLAAVGVPSSKTYSHIAFTPRARFDRSREPDISYAKSVMYTPSDAAFGAEHSAGFTTYPNRDRFSEIYKIISDRGGPPWVSAEGTNVDFENGPPQVPRESMEDYLARMFNHGAVVANVFGWGIGEASNPFRRATESDDAIASYRKFLRGVGLKEKPLSESYLGNKSLFRSLLDRLGQYPR